jgi:hypothetical protein
MVVGTEVVCGSAAVSTGTQVHRIYGRGPYKVEWGRGEVTGRVLRERVASAAVCIVYVPSASAMLRERA